MTALNPPIASPLAGLTVGDVMHPGVITCLPDATLSTVATIMTAHGIHSVVLPQPDRPAPLIVTDLELIRAALTGVDDARATDVAREPAVTLSTDASLEDAVAMMAVSYVAHVLVIDPSTGAPAGIISSFDVAAVAGGYEPRLARILRPDRTPTPGARTLRDARIGDVMHPGVATCPPDTPVSIIARSMAAHRVHCVAIAGVDSTSGNGEHLTWGLIDDLDLVVALHRGALDAPAATIAESAPLALQTRATLDRAAALMVEHETRHVVAVGRHGLACGMVSTLDVAWVLAGSP